MIPKEILQAMELIDTYKESVSELLGKRTYTCICCQRNEVSVLYPELLNPLIPQDMSWNGGKVERIGFGWGSKHDLESFFVAICDECIDELIKKDLIVSYRSVKQKLSEIDENGELF